MNEFILTSTVNDLLLVRWDLILARRDLNLLKAKRQAMIDAKAAQQVRQPLSDDAVLAMWRESDFRGSGGQFDWFAEGVRASERHHGIGGKPCLLR